MSIARITEVSSTSQKSFEDAIQSGVARATQTLRNVRSAWVKEQQIRIDQGKIIEYQVNLMITLGRGRPDGRRLSPAGAQKLACRETSSPAGTRSLFVYRRGRAQQ